MGLINDQCFLPPDRPTQVNTLMQLYPFRQAGTRFTYSGGMVGWVDLSGWLHAELVCLPIDTDFVEQLRWSSPTRYNHCTRLPAVVCDVFTYIVWNLLFTESLMSWSASDVTSAVFNVFWPRCLQWVTVVRVLLWNTPAEYRYAARFINQARDS